MIRPRNSHRFLGIIVLGCLITAGTVLFVQGKSDNPTGTSVADSASLANRAVSPRRARPDRPPVKPSGIGTISVRLQSKEKSALYTMTDPEAVGAIWGSQNSAPKSTRPAGKSFVETGLELESISPTEAAAPGVATPVVSFPGPDFDDDKTETGFWFVPPDPIAAAGPGHLVDVINVLVNFYQEDGTADFQDSLFDFFADLNPNTFTFDPKVVYDPFSGRFVIVSMDVTDFQFDGFDSSRLLVAVSDDEDPNGTWCVGDIDALSTFVGQADDQNALDHWAEYPGLAVDEEAVYITAEMRTFLSQTPPDEFGGVRLWIIDKANDGLYDCVANPVDLAQVDVFDPFAGGGGGIVLTSQPAQIYGTPPSGNVGTFLVSKGNLTDGTDEFAQVIRVDDPLGSPSFAQSFVNIGNIEDLVGNETDPPLPNAPQSGSAELIDTNDRRALDAVWRQDNLYFSATIDPKPGDPDAGQATAFWARIDTSNLGSLSTADQGVILGEEIGAATHTFYPSIAIDNTGAMAIGFSASGATIFPSAYFTYRQAADGAGITQPSSLVQAGQASYLRPFGPRNRWGDYTGTAVHPLEAGCFWIFNQYAGEQDPQDTPPENGRWETQWAKFCVADSDIFADGFESSDTSAWSSVVP